MKPPNVLSAREACMAMTEVGAPTSTVKRRVRPLGARLVVKVDEALEKTLGGIVLPDAAKEKPRRGEVLAVGPGRLLDSGALAKLGVKEGQTVLYGAYAGTEIKVDGEEVLILDEGDVLAILD